MVSDLHLTPSFAGVGVLLPYVLAGCG
jgi:hypothetical protein